MPIIEDAKDQEDDISDRVHTLNSEKGEVLVLGTIKGLLSEKDIVRRVSEEFEPDVIGLHISIEEIRGLKKVIGGKIKSTYLSSYEKVYARELSKFGEIQIPPPSLVEAYRISEEMEIPIRSLDYNDNRYSEVYTECIDGVSMVRQSLRQKRVNRKKFKSKTPEGFCIEWDGAANRLKGYRLLENRREKKISERIQKLARKFRRVLAVVELERMEGIISRLSSEN